MTLVLIGKGLVLEGWPSKIEVSRVLGIYIIWLFYYIWYIHLQATGDSSPDPTWTLEPGFLKGGHKKPCCQVLCTFNWAMNKQTPGCLGTFWGWNTYIPSYDGIITSKYKDPFKYCVLLCSSFDFYSRRWSKLTPSFRCWNWVAQPARNDSGRMSNFALTCFFTFATRKAVILSNKNTGASNTYCMYYTLYYYIFYTYTVYIFIYIYLNIYICYWEVSQNSGTPNDLHFRGLARGHPRPLSVAPKNSTARRLIQKPMERMVIQESWWRYNPCFRGH